jgi:SlyX protein
LNERIQLLEEKIAYLERHVADQDKAMLELVEDAVRLRRELGMLRDRLESTGPGDGAARPGPDERPPHY